jgi:molybdenum-dependent DNA-binding transcriptional regulator ModE
LGRKDGGAQLTPKGREFIGEVDSLLKDLQTIVEKRFKETFEAYSLGKGK